MSANLSPELMFNRAVEAYVHADRSNERELQSAKDLLDKALLVEIANILGDSGAIIDAIIMNKSVAGRAGENEPWDYVTNKKLLEKILSVTTWPAPRSHYKFCNIGASDLYADMTNSELVDLLKNNPQAALVHQAVSTILNQKSAELVRVVNAEQSAEIIQDISNRINQAFSSINVEEFNIALGVIANKVPSSASVDELFLQEPIIEVFSEEGDKILVEEDIVNRFEYMAQKYPAQIAIQYQNKSVTYQELNDQINQLANFAINNGFIKSSAPDRDEQARIGIRGSNKLDIIITQIACLKVGAAYVVIDKDDASEKASFMAQDALLDTIINCDDELEPLALPNCTVAQHYLSTIKQNAQHESKDNLNLVIDSNRLAYTIYTSGSTGQPKGVMQSRKGITGQIKYYSEGLGLTPHDRILGVSPITHDQGMANVYSALLNGCGLYLHDLKENKFQDVVSYIQENDITVYVSVPSVWKQIGIMATNEALESLRIVRLGGEESTIYHAQLYQQKCNKDAQFITAYGASECSFMSLNTITKDTDLSTMNSIPLGTLMKHVTCHTPPSEPGGIATPDDDMPLMVSSPYMAWGYTSVEENRRVYQDIGGVKFYKTGDRVKINENQFHFTGREAWHEKIQGNRVNLHGIENIIEQCAKQHGCQCVVVAIGEGDGKKIVAWITGDEANTIDINQLQKDIKNTSSLPPYAMPFKIKYLEKFPELPNKKTDRNALKKMAESEFLSQEELFFDQIRNEQDLIANMRAIWSDILSTDISSYTEDDNTINFLQLGGESISAIMLSAFINKIINKSVLNLSNEDTTQILSASDLFTTQSLAMFNKLILEKIEQYRSYKNSETIHAQMSNIHTKEQPYAKRHFVYAYELNNDAACIAQYPELYSLSSLNYSAMSQLVAQSCKKNGTKIHLCKTQSELIDFIEKTICQLNPETHEIGIIFPKNIDPRSHRVPAILSFNSETETWDLFISDSFQELESVMQANFVKHGIKPDIMEKLRIYVDPCDRQSDLNSCNIDALLYVENGLKGNFRQNIYITDSTTNGYQEFFSPPDCMQGYQHNILNFLCSFIVTLRLDLNYILSNSDLDALKELESSNSEEYFTFKAYLESFHIIDKAGNNTSFYTASEISTLLAKIYLSPSSLQNKLISYLNNSIENKKYAEYIQHVVTKIENNIKPSITQTYLLFDNDKGVKKTTVLGLQEEPSPEQLQALTPHHIILRKHNDGALIYWRNRTDETGYHTKLWSKNKIPYEIMERISSREDLREEDFEHVESQIYSNLYCYGVVQKKRLSSVNTYYYQNSDQFYNTVMYGSKLNRLESDLTDYLHELHLTKNNLKKDPLSTTDIHEKNLIESKIHAVQYLKILFRFDNADTYPSIKIDFHQHAGVLFGIENQTADKRTTKILHKFAKSLEGDFIFSHKNEDIDANEGKRRLDTKSLITLFQDEYNYTANPRTKIYVQSLNGDFFDMELNREQSVFEFKSAILRKLYPNHSISDDLIKEVSEKFILTHLGQRMLDQINLKNYGLIRTTTVFFLDRGALSLMKERLSIPNKESLAPSKPNNVEPKPTIESASSTSTSSVSFSSSPSPKITVYVKFTDGQKLEVKLDKKQSIFELKLAIFCKLYPDHLISDALVKEISDKFNLIFSGKKLFDDITLEQYNIQNETSVFAIDLGALSLLRERLGISDDENTSITLKETEDFFSKNIPDTDNAIIAVGDGMDRQWIAFVAGDPQSVSERITQINTLTEDMQPDMIPSQVVHLSEMPHLADGKINYDALRQLFLSLKPKTASSAPVSYNRTTEANIAKPAGGVYAQRSGYTLFNPGKTGDKASAAKSMTKDSRKITAPEHIIYHPDESLTVTSPITRGP